MAVLSQQGVVLRRNAVVSKLVVRVVYLGYHKKVLGIQNKQEIPSTFRMAVLSWQDVVHRRNEVVSQLVVRVVFLSHHEKVLGIETRKDFQVHSGWQCCHGKVLSSEKGNWYKVTERVVLQGVVPGRSKASEDHHHPGKSRYPGYLPFGSRHQGLQGDPPMQAVNMTTVVNSDAQGLKANRAMVGAHLPGGLAAGQRIEHHASIH